MINTIEINLRREFETLKKHPNYTIFDANSEIHDYLNAKPIMQKKYFIKVKHYILADYLRDCVKQKKTF